MAYYHETELQDMALDHEYLAGLNGFGLGDCECGGDESRVESMFQQGPLQLDNKVMWLLVGILAVGAIGLLKK